MLHEIQGLFVEFAVQAVFLAAALWIMIKLQKLDYNFPGLLGTAVLVSALDRVMDTVLGHFLGDYLASYVSAPIDVAVLFICVSMVTHADKVDVFFTIGVGYALMFGMNLWLFGAMLGDLRPSAGNSREFDTVTRQEETNGMEQTAGETNPPVQNAQQPVPAAPTNAVIARSPAPPATAANGLFSVKGVTQSGPRSAVTIQTGKKTYTIFLGESALTQTVNGPVSVRFKELGDGWVVLAIDGQETKLPFH